MLNRVDISLRGIEATDALERLIDEEARKLERVYERVRSCQVVAEALPRQKQRSAHVAVRLIIGLPGKEIVVNREHGADVRLAVSEAFAAAATQLKDHVRRLDRREGRCAKETGNRGR